MSSPKSCPERSLRNYHYTVRNIPEYCRSQGDSITMVTLKLYSLETFPFQKGTSQAPHIFMLPVCPFTTTLLSHSSPHKPLTDLHAIRSHKFEGHLYAFSYTRSSHQTPIRTWRTRTSLPSVCRFGVHE